MKMKRFNYFLMIFALMTRISLSMEITVFLKIHDQNGHVLTVGQNFLSSTCLEDAAKRLKEHAQNRGLATKNISKRISEGKHYFLSQEDLQKSLSDFDNTSVVLEAEKVNSWCEIF